MRAKIYAVVVAFRSDPGAVFGNLRQILDELGGCIVVDNSGSTDAGRWKEHGSFACPLHVICNGYNAGVARGFNQGIETALGVGADLVLLLDEDSRPGQAMLGRLVSAWRECSERGDRVAAIGPDFRDTHSGERGVFVRFEHGWLRRAGCGEADRSVIRSEYLMSSGSLIPRQALEAVGMLEEALFVDYVDTEWCLRARSLGYKCYAACAARMEHDFGLRGLPVWWLRGRRIPYRHPVRHYFAYRNALLMMRRRYVPVRWKINELKRLLLLLLVYLSCAPSPGGHLRCMLYGALHGIRGRSGPAPAGIAQ